MSVSVRPGPCGQHLELPGHECGPQALLRPSGQGSPESLALPSREGLCRLLPLL